MNDYLNSLPKGVSVWVPSQNTKECIEMAVKMWINEYPKEVQAFADQIKRKRDGLHRVDGMSKDGHFKEYLEVPTKLDYKIRQMTHDRWMQDEKICRLIKQLMPDLNPYKGRNESKVLFEKGIDE